MPDILGLKGLIGSFPSSCIAGLESFPYREIAQKQTSGWSGMLSFYIKDAGLKESKAFLSKVKVFTWGPSLGSVESLILIP